MTNEVATFKNWLVAALVRAAKTAAQAAIAVIGTTVYFGAVDWAMVGGSALLAAILSVLTSVAGIPEISDGDSVFAIVGNGEGTEDDEEGSGE